MAEWSVTDDVLVHEEEGEALLLNVADGHYYALNRTGAVVWQALNDGTDPIAAVTAAWPDIPSSAVETDVAKVLDDLAAAGLVRRVEGPNRT
ncbi:MAG: hypothetical protein QOE35_2735 [Actinomycetota bacterium]|jgi:hypothetical protein